jgi:hypothetical protein
MKLELGAKGGKGNGGLAHGAAGHPNELGGLRQSGPVDSGHEHVVWLAKQERFGATCLKWCCQTRAGHTGVSKRDKARQGGAPLPL